MPTPTHRGRRDEVRNPMARKNTKAKNGRNRKRLHHGPCGQAARDGLLDPTGRRGRQALLLRHRGGQGGFLKNPKGHLERPAPSVAVEEPLGRRLAAYHRGGAGNRGTRRSSVSLIVYRTPGAPLTLRIEIGLQGAHLGGIARELSTSHRFFDAPVDRVSQQRDPP
jgi:hypothetical protein